jgi:hypothetical protein
MLRGGREALWREERKLIKEGQRILAAAHSTGIYLNIYVQPGHLQTKDAGGVVDENTIRDGRASVGETNELHG